MVLRGLFIALMATGLLSCSAPLSEEENLEVERAAALIEKDAVELIDVRSEDEVADGYIAGAKHLNFHEDDFDQKLEELPRDKPYLIYCHSGGRSSRTVARMREMGFEEVYNLKGGIVAWKEEGRETLK